MELNDALILAAGYGTRLGSNLSKPLIEVAGMSIISRLMQKLREVEIGKVCIITNDLYYDSYLQWSKDITNEFVQFMMINDMTRTNEERLGALKDTSFALSRMYPKGEYRSTMIVLGDNLFEDSLVGITAFYKEMQRSVIGVHDVRSPEMAKRFGIVELDESGKIISFEEKPPQPRSTLASTGIYLYTPEALQALDKYLEDGNPHDRPGDFLVWLTKQCEVYGYRLSGRWWDIGSPEALEDAKAYYSLRN